MKRFLRWIGRDPAEASLPVSGQRDCNDEPQLEQEPQEMRGALEIKVSLKAECPAQIKRHSNRGNPGDSQPKVLLPGRPKQISKKGVLNVKVNHQRGNKPQPKAEKRPGELEEALRRCDIEELGVQRQEGTSEEARQREAEEEENALEIALAAMAENDHHPEERQQGPYCERDESEIEQPTHEANAASLTLERKAGQ